MCNYTSTVSPGSPSGERNHKGDIDLPKLAAPSVNLDSRSSETVICST